MRCARRGIVGMRVGAPSASAAARTPGVYLRAGKRWIVSTRTKPVGGGDCVSGKMFRV